ncbi:MAG: DMT family transporter [Rhodobacteraceae bacterium]|nr:DMT family transporter [Paracoccaceae bacterium]MBR9822680.1 DMT family transporter [Paracoccaceae bacterium]
MGSTRGIGFALVAFAIFSGHDAIIKILGGNYSAFQMVWLTVLMSFPLTSVILIRDARPGTLRPEHPWWMLLRTLASVVAAGCGYYAFSVLPMADTYAILFASPLLITVLSIPILGEKVRLRRWLAVIVGLIGVGVVLQPGNAALGPGHFAAMAGAACGALSSVIVRKIGKEERNVVMLIYPLLANFVLMGALMPFYYKPVPALHMGGFFAIALLSVVAMLFMISAYRNSEAALVAPMQYSQILWATFYGWLLFDEFPGTNVAAGSVLIIGSGLYIVIRESRQGGSSKQPVLRSRNRTGTPAALRIGPLMRMRSATRRQDEQPDGRRA